MKSNSMFGSNNRFSLDKMKWMLVFISIFSSMSGFSQVSVNSDGSAPDPSAMLEVKATGRGFLLPRMNLAQRPAAPATGLVLYQLDSGPGIYFYNGAAWQKMSLAAYDFWNPNGPDIYFNTGRVGIGTTTPDNHGLNVVNYAIAKGAVRGADQDGVNIYAEGYLGVLAPSYLGVPLNVTNVGVLGIKVANGGNGAAVYGWNNDNNSSNYAGLFFSDGTNTASGTNYGIYAAAQKANANYAGYFKGRVTVDGNSGSNMGDDTTSTLFYAQVNHSRAISTQAIYGYSKPVDGYGYGVHGYGGYIGLYGQANGGADATTSYGVYGYAFGTAGTRVGVYGYAAGGATNWGSYFVGSNYMSGDLRIGTTTEATGYTLSVNGKIACEEVLVQDMASWPDYVFKSDYNLMSLHNLEQSIKENGHLPGLPSAQDIETNGLHLGNMQKQVVEKVEELTLYTIEQAKMLQELKQEFKKEIDALKAENASLKKAIKN